MSLNSLVVKLASWVPPALLQKIVKVSVPNLAGDRDIEWSWIAAHIQEGPGEALDFGTGSSTLGFIAAQRRFTVTSVDLGKIHWLYVQPGLRFVQGDILDIELPEGRFDLVINCSTVEHVGLSGRYGVKKSMPDGDIEAMSRLRGLMKPCGTMLLTVPVGQDAVFPPMTRVYGTQRLPRLLEGFTTEKKNFWIKDSGNRWIMTDEETALKTRTSAGSWNPLKNFYGLGCFVLKK
jgi:hypothetical protein